MPELHEARQFLACCDCDAVQQVGPGIVADDDRADCTLFACEHQGHRVQILAQVGPTLLADRPLWDPMATTWHEVTNGSEVMVLCSSRDSIEDPRRHTVIPGRLRCHRVDIDVDRDLVRRALDHHFHPHVVPTKKVERMLSALEDLVRSLDPDSLSILFDCAEDPRVSITAVPPFIQNALLHRCGHLFDGWELGRIRAFVVRNFADDGLLTLRVTRTFDLARDERV